ncbi:hypothetical protein DBZ36_19895 [Alginatibacterium sediminis]|uniref:WD40 repeat domain-containing protein n=1 Tax=Alginatibacterium sediminis TaxID=2164068 RepID=A0A420E6A6_9ALTE|nr:hypothetical protein [Alginatibacterium sediminis]RKF13323.1 hypothetical protein DBZ36_19895 [Alginatibacterium sediminis]
MKKIILLVICLFGFALFGVYLSLSQQNSTQNSLENPIGLTAQASFSSPEPAASLIWHASSQSWLLGTQSSNDLLGSRPAQLLRFDENFTYIDRVDLESSGDLFGLSLINSEQLAASSFDSKLIFLKLEQQAWSYVGKRKLFQDRLRHRTRAMLWDPDLELLVSCEHLGAKLCYQHSREGQLLKTMPILELHSGRPIDPSESALSSITKLNNSYYILSQDSGTIYEVDLTNFKISKQFQISLAINEQAVALAVKDQNLYLLSAVRSRDNQSRVYRLDLGQNL